MTPGYMQGGGTGYHNQSYRGFTDGGYLRTQAAAAEEPTVGVDNLTTTITFNSSQQTSVCRYKGGDASASGWNAWTTGENLVYSGTGTAPNFNVGSDLSGPNDDAVEFVGSSRHYLAATTGLADIGTDDFFMEIYVRMNSSGLETWVGKRLTVGGWLFRNIGARVQFFADDGGTSIASAIGLTVGNWMYITVFGNRDEASTNGSAIAVNGVQSGAGVDITAGSDFGNATDKLHISHNADVNAYSDRMSFVQIWHAPSWFASGATGLSEFVSVSAARYSALIA